MAIMVSFQPKGMTAKKYDEVIRRLEAAGQGKPKGRIEHVAFGPPEALRVCDVWASPAELEAFGKILGPLLGALGIELPPPEVAPVHSRIA